MKFSIPHNQILEIKPSKQLDEDFGYDEEIEGVVWNIYWNKRMFPWHIKTQNDAFAIALGCQWMIKEYIKSMNYELREKFYE
jgi:hypothetical protein